MTPVRVCERAACGKPLEQRTGEWDARFASRRFCNTGCSTSRNCPHDRTELGSQGECLACRRDNDKRKQRTRQQGGRSPRRCPHPVPDRDSRGRCRLCRRERDAERGRESRPYAVRNPTTRGRKPQPRPVGEGSVFGDKPPSTPWRPAAWRDREVAS